MRNSIIVLVIVISSISAANADEVYKCINENGRTTYSDKPCGPKNVLLDLKPIVEDKSPRNAYTNRPSLPINNSTESSRVLQPQAGYSSDQAKEKSRERKLEACFKSYAQARDQINALMRQGHSSAQGERYREQERQNEKRYSKCKEQASLETGI